MMSIRLRQSLLNSALQRPSALSSVPRSLDLLWLDKNENLWFCAFSTRKRNDDNYALVMFSLRFPEYLSVSLNLVF